jgi:hypothetical protein
MGTIFGDIRFKRGPEVNLPSLEEGQPAFTKDTKRVFVGTDSGNIELVKQTDMVPVIEGLSENATDLQNRAVNVKNPPSPLVAAVNDANYYNSTDTKWYKDSDFTQLSTDNSSVFSALETLGLPLFCPKGNYYAPNLELNGWYFGKGAMIICKEKTTYNNSLPPSQQTGIRNYILGTSPQPVLNEFYGKGSGNSLQADAYANTAIGESALTNLTTGKRNTAIGYQAMKSNPTQYSNTAIGADSLSTGRFFERSTAIGDNSMKWTGILDPIQTRHEFWINEYDQVNIWQSGQTFGYLQDNNPNIAQIIQPTGYTAPAGATIVNPGGGFPASTSSTDNARNVALGRDSLLHLVKGSDNVGIGYQALTHSYTSDSNTAVGNYSLRDNLAGVQNVAIGKSAFQQNQSGANNTIVGAGAETDNITGSRNVVLGSNAGAGHTGSNSIIIGYKAKHPTVNRDRQLVIDYGNDVNAIPFIYGEFDSGLIQFRATQMRLGGDGGSNGGIRITVGTGVPSVAHPDGSMFIRTDGGAGSALYVRQNGAWVAK